MVTPCINNTEPFFIYYQLMHITLKRRANENILN